MTREIQEIEESRERFLDLLLLADPSVELVQHYLAEGHLFVLFEQGEACGVVHLLPQTGTVMEVKNIAVKEEAQGRGYGKRLLHYALDFCRRQGYEKVIVGTGNSSINNLAFYQKAGFRFLSIMRNFFTDHYDEPIFEHGIQYRDMILLEVDFAQQSEPPQKSRFHHMEVYFFVISLPPIILSYNLVARLVGAFAIQLWGKSLSK